MPGDGLAIVAGRGLLPRLIAEDCARAGGSTGSWCSTAWRSTGSTGHPVLGASFEKPGRLFAALKAAGCGDVTFAGGIVRPHLRLLGFDLKMLRLAPRLIRGLRSGDDTTLRLVAAIFEAEGFAVKAPQEILTDLVARPGVLGRVRPTPADRADVARAAAIVAALGDGGRRAGRGGGGRDSASASSRSRAPTRCCASWREPLPELRRSRGVLFKAPKPGQDRRVDLPAIGPGTLEGAAAAGLAGVAIEAGGVMILGFEATVGAADAAGLFLWSREAGT